jgi:hypothetical protein
LSGIRKFKRAGGADKERRQTSVRGWLPLDEIRGYTAKAGDGRYSAFLRVVPVNLSLKSDNEKKRVVSALHEAVNGLKEPVQVFSSGRPIDLDGYIRHIGEKSAAETNPVKKRLLKEYLRYTSGLVSEGEAHERRFYFVLSRENEEATLAAAGELAGALRAAGLESHLCDAQEILNLLFCFFNPEKAALEKTGPPSKMLPAVYS